MKSKIYLLEQEQDQRNQTEHSVYGDKVEIKADRGDSKKSSVSNTAVAHKDG